MSFVSLNGKLIPAEEALISITNIELFYGFGVYETLKMRNSKLFFVKEHVDRLFNSAKQITLDHPFKKNQIKKWVQELVTQGFLDQDESASGGSLDGKHGSVNIKIILLGGKTKQDARLYMFLTNPLFIEKKDYRKGIKVITFENERFAPQAKTLNMLPSYVAHKKAKQVKAYDALLIDNNNNIVEGTRSNFFAIKNKTLYTPPESKILNGITRKTVIDCAKKNKYKVIEKNIKFQKIFTYDGAFLTNTSGKIVPIKTINKKSFKEISEPLAILRKLYNEYLKTTTTNH